MATHHARFLRFDWFGNLGRQAQMQLFFEGPLSRASVPAALAAAAFVAGGGRLTFGWIGRLALVCASALTLGAAGTALLLGLLGGHRLLRRGDGLVGWLVLAWLAV